MRLPIADDGLAVKVTIVCDRAASNDYFSVD